MSVALIWFFVGLACLVLELILPGFIVIFFAFGCFIASLSAWLLDISLTIQGWVFLLSSLVLLLTLRKAGLQLLRGNIQGNVADEYIDAKVGKRALVTKGISPEHPGEIKLMGSFWRAVSSEIIEEGKTVVVESKVSEDGLTFNVKPLDM